jgi:hypothetical protein
MLLSAPSQPAAIAQLRHLLAEKFPSLQPKTGGILPTGIADLDKTEGGLRRAALTELSCASGTGALFIHAMLRMLDEERCFGALVDARRSFEPDGAEAALAHLLVVFCASAVQSVKAVDLLLRDGNFALVMLDLQVMPLRDAERIPASAWHRLQRLAEQSTTATVVLTRQPMVEAAQVRITVMPCWTLAAQRYWRRDLVGSAAWRVFPRRVNGLAAPPKEYATA